MEEMLPLLPGLEARATFKTGTATGLLSKLALGVDADASRLNGFMGTNGLHLPACFRRGDEKQAWGFLSG